MQHTENTENSDLNYTKSEVPHSTTAKQRQNDEQVRQRNIVGGRNNNKETLERQTPGTGSPKKGYEEDAEEEEKYLFWALCFRIPILIFWTGTLLYATWHVYLAAEEYVVWHRDPVMNPGPFTSFLNRGRDRTDYEWTMFTQSFFFTIILWYSLYLIISRVTQHYFPGKLPFISASVTFLFLINLLGIVPTIVMYLIPVKYWLIIGLRRKGLIWPFTFLYLIFLNSPLAWKLIPLPVEMSSYYFFITAAWTVARCVSFSFDTWDRNYKWDSSSLSFFLAYCFYLPLTINGPLVLYNSYEQSIINSPRVPKTKAETVQDVKKLGCKLLKYGFFIAVTEVILHYLYFRPLSLTRPALYEINFWAMSGIIYWLGQFFQLKYFIMYGIPSAMAEFEGLPMYPLPKCIAYIHRYSALWKDFDRGLYHFLVRYTYVPSMEIISKLDTSNRISLEFRKLMASFASFVYVYIWHSTSYEVLVWAWFNFLGITLERIGSVIKTKIDSQYKIKPYVWDIIVEPIVTVPLAIMSVLNSAVFCGRLGVARIGNQRFWAGGHYIPCFFFCFTTVGVTIRTWKTAYPKAQRYCYKKFGISLPSIGISSQELKRDQ